jgi:hypothetical protein
MTKMSRGGRERQPLFICGFHCSSKSKEMFHSIKAARLLVWQRYLALCINKKTPRLL